MLHWGTTSLGEAQVRAISRMHGQTEPGGRGRSHARLYRSRNRLDHGAGGDRLRHRRGRLPESHGLQGVGAREAAPEGPRSPQAGERGGRRAGAPGGVAAPERSRGTRPGLVSRPVRLRVRSGRERSSGRSTRPPPGCSASSARRGCSPPFIREHHLVDTSFVTDPELRDDLASGRPGYPGFLEHRGSSPSATPTSGRCRCWPTPASRRWTSSEAPPVRLSLKDATAYNVQFVDGRPMFIDLSS